MECASVTSQHPQNSGPYTTASTLQHRVTTAHSQCSLSLQGILILGPPQVGKPLLLTPAEHLLDELFPHLLSMLSCDIPLPLLQCCKSHQQESNSTTWHQETISCTGLFTLPLLSTNLAFSKILIISLLLLRTSWAWCYTPPHTTMSSMYRKRTGALPSSKTFCTSPWHMTYASILVAEGSRHIVLLSR